MGYFKKQLKTLFPAAGMVLLTGLAGISGSVIASTPDGETPANEGVCDMLFNNGVTKGLYGLCVAYCEAQDLDEFGDEDPPNNKILENYNRKKQNSDPDMPCVRAPCPCWSPAELYAITSNVIGGIQLCEVNEAAGFAEIDTIIQGVNGTQQRAQVSRFGTDAVRCRYLDKTLDPRISTVIGLGELPFTQGIEDQACWDAVVAACSP